MSPDNPKQILTAHDLSQFRALHSVGAATATTLPVTTGTAYASNVGNNSNNNHATNMVLSSIPLDGHAVVIQQHNLLPAATAQTQQQQQQRIAAASNGYTVATRAPTTATATTNNVSNLIAAATKATIINTGNNNSYTISNSSNNNTNNMPSNSNNNNMPTTSKYVFLQQNGNGQYTTYEGTTSTTGNNVGNIVLVATEPMELSTATGGNETNIISTGGAGGGASGENDCEELRPLSWLNDKNLIKAIVTSSTNNAQNAAANKRSGVTTNNICIVNANGTHEYIEDLPTHVACEEHVTTISTTAANNSSSNNNTNTSNNLTTTLHHDMPETQITTMSVSDFQQQFITSNIAATGNHKRSNHQQQQQQQLATLTNFALAQDQTTTSANGKDPPQHIYGNIATLGATTTVHVGPSGTTTVVEYKSNSNFMPAQRPFINGISNSSGQQQNVASNNHNNYVPSSTTTASSLSSATLANNCSNNIATSSPATATAIKPHQTITLPANANTVVIANGNNTNNTIFQQQQQQPKQGNNNNSSTTHHPHKKYLREKMNGFDQGGGVGGGGATIVSSSSSNHNYNSSTSSSVVSSPANSSNSNASTLSSSLSTAAVNGANSPSPISKSSSSNTSYYTLIGNAVTTSLGGSIGDISGIGSSGSAGNIGGGLSLGTVVNYSNAFVAHNNNTATSTTTPPTVGATITATSTPNATTSYTIINPQNQNVINSPSISSSPETHSTKEYYTTLQTHQQQQQQQHHHHISIKSPTSYSSYENDSLKDFEISTTHAAAAQRLGGTSTPQQQQQQQQHHHQNLHSPTSMHHNQMKSSISPASSSASSSVAAGGGGGGGSGTPQKQKHPNNVPYDPLVHTHNKPPYSFSSLIFMAIEGSNEKALPVKEIYAWIVSHFPYFKTAPTGWKNSVRHNLSLNKSFVKVEKAPNMGKGSLWRVEQQQRQNLIQALTRSPFFPNSAVDKINLKHGNGGNYDTIDAAISPNSLTNGTSAGVGGAGAGAGMLGGGGVTGKSCIDARFDARLFPKLSKVFKDMEEHNALNDSVDMADEDIPSDYSTTNNNNSNKYQYSSNNTPAMQQQQQQQHQNGMAGAESIGGNTNISSGGDTNVAFKSYDSMERLARDCGADSIDDVNAATAMLALKHGPKVFAETFQNGSPVITSSPSEDHTYSAGGGTGSSNGSSTVGGNSNMNTNNVAGSNDIANGVGGGMQHGCDNQSNCASSDAAYESSEENHNITPEELADQQRHRDGVDALLSLSLSSFIDSSSPIKRPPSTTVEEEHISSCNENLPTTTMTTTQMSAATTIPTGAGKMALMSVNAGSGYLQQQQQQHAHHHHHHHHSMLDEGYNTQSYYGNNNNNNNSHTSHYIATTLSSMPKKPKPLRNLRAKIKRKTAWIR